MRGRLSDPALPPYPGCQAVPRGPTVHEAVLRGVQRLEIGAIALAAVRWAMNTPGSRDLNDGLLTPLGDLLDFD